MCGCPDYPRTYNKHNGILSPVCKRCWFAGRGKTIQKFYVEEFDDNHSENREPEDYIGSSSGVDFAHNNIGGAYHQYKVAEEHPEESH